MAKTDLLVTYRFESASTDRVVRRDILVRGLTLRIFAGLIDSKGQQVRVLERWGARLGHETELQTVLSRELREARRNFGEEQRLERQLPVRVVEIAPVA